jgi:STE24 endopeptidase
MPILLIFLLAAACLPVEWPAPPFGLGPGGSAALTAAAVGLPLLAAFALRTWVVRTLARHPDRRSGVGQGYVRLRRVLFFVNVGAVALSIVGLGWGWTTQHLLTVPWNGDEILAPFAELAVPLPYFLILAGCWLIYYDAERALHRASAEGGRPFWSRPGYFLHHLRSLALLVAIPVGLFVTQQSLARVAPESTREDWYRVASLAVVPVMIVFLPLVIRPLLGLRPLPAGPVRDRIEALARRLHFRYTDLLVWPTHGSTANAMIVGLVPRIRYVIFTDRVLEEMPADELDAVFGHEVGHARHGHIGYYALFLALSMTVLAALLLLVVQQLVAAARLNPTAWYAGLVHADAWWMALPPIGLAAGYVFLAFGFLSRRCERQADVFGCRAVSCGNPGCTGHDEATVYPDRGAGLCPTGIRTCARALERVYHLNGYDLPPAAARRTLGTVLREAALWVRAWQHLPIPRRVAFLLSLIDDPGRERRFQWRVWALRWGLVVGLVAALVGLGEAVGWRALLAAL